MSAECNIHGTDLLYDDEGHATICDACDLAALRAERDRLQARLDATMKGLNDAYTREPTIIADRDRFKAALEAVRPSHLVVEEDCWFSCPESGQSCNDDTPNGSGCTCSAERVNAIIDSALAAARGGGANGSPPPSRRRHD